MTQTSVINKAKDNGNVCDKIGCMDDVGIWAIIVTCSVNDGIFVQNEHARRDHALYECRSSCRC